MRNCYINLNEDEELSKVSPLDTIDYWNIFVEKVNNFKDNISNSDIIKRVKKYIRNNKSDKEKCKTFITNIEKLKDKDTIGNKIRILAKLNFSELMFDIFPEYRDVILNYIKASITDGNIVEFLKKHPEYIDSFLKEGLLWNHCGTMIKYFPEYKDKILDNCSFDECISWVSLHNEDIKYFKDKILEDIKKAKIKIRKKLPPDFGKEEEFIKTCLNTADKIIAYLEKADKNLDKNAIGYFSSVKDRVKNKDNFYEYLDHYFQRKLFFLAEISPEIRNTIVFKKFNKRTMVFWGLKYPEYIKHIIDKTKDISTLLYYSYYFRNNIDAKVFLDKLISLGIKDYSFAPFEFLGLQNILYMVGDDIRRNFIKEINFNGDLAEMWICAFPKDKLEVLKRLNTPEKVLDWLRFYPDDKIYFESFFRKLKV